MGDRRNVLCFGVATIAAPSFGGGFCCRHRPTSAAGRFMLVVLAGAAEMERNLTRERTRAAMAVKRANGQRIGSVPYGFDLENDGSTLVPNTTEQAIVKDIRAMRKSGKTLHAIADALTERGVPTKTGKSNRWSHSAVDRILHRNSSSTP